MRLWDDCLELEAYIQSHSANSVYCLDGKVPKTYMSRETTDISQFCKLAWYEWGIYRPRAVEYPNNLLCLGRYLGLAIDVGPAMTAKILQHNGEVVYRSMYWPLTAEAKADGQVQLDILTFREGVEELLGTKLTWDALEEVGIPDTPEYLPYANKDQNEGMFPNLDEEITPETGDEYVYASIMLPRGSKMVCGAVIACKHDKDGNPIRRQSDNPNWTRVCMMWSFPEVTSPHSLQMQLHKQCMHSVIWTGTSTYY